MQVVLCQTADIPEGAMKRFELMGYDILAMNVGGTFYALDAWCTYRYAALEDGRVDADKKVLICKDCSGSWELATGAPKDAPAEFPLTAYEIVPTGDDLVLTFTY